jgi:hypothetical protein
MSSHWKEWWWWIKMALKLRSKIGWTILKVARSPATAIVPRGNVLIRLRGSLALLIKIILAITMTFLRRSSRHLTSLTQKWRKLNRQSCQAALEEQSRTGKVHLNSKWGRWAQIKSRLIVDPIWHSLVKIPLKVISWSQHFCRIQIRPKVRCNSTY